MESKNADQRPDEKTKRPDEDQAKGPINGLYNFNHRGFYINTMKVDAFVLYYEEGRDPKVEESWKTVAKNYKDKENVKIGQVNLSKEREICMEQGILGYPMVKYYHEANEIESHSISDNADDLISFIDDKLKRPPPEVEDNVKHLTYEVAKDVINDGVTFLNFHHTKCGFCKRMERAWKQLSNEDFGGVSTPVRIASLNCEGHEDECREIGCCGYPTLLLFVDGKAVATYTSKRTVTGFKDFIYQILNVH